MRIYIFDGARRVVKVEMGNFLWFFGWPMDFNYQPYFIMGFIGLDIPSESISFSFLLALGKVRYAIRCKLFWFSRKLRKS